MHTRTELLSDNAHDQEVRRNTHPPDWQNPAPRPRYDLVVVGGGTAGLVSAGIGGLLGATVALVERDLMGGDCLVTGCVPSKALIRAARVASEVRGAAAFGVRVPAGMEVDFAAAMARMRRVRAKISQHDAVRAFSETYGVHVFLGDARFVARDAVEVAGQRLRFGRAIIATGARATRPEVSGLAEGGFYTNETIFNLTERPRRLAVVGGGPIGCELAQAFARLGSEVTIIDRGDRLLHREDPEAASVLHRVLSREGIQIVLGATLERVARAEGGNVLHLRQTSRPLMVQADAILVGVGRTPNVETLTLEAGGVEHDRHGVKVDDYLRTTNPRIYAAGDVCLRYKFTHTADASARVAAQNALTIPWKRWSKQVIPRVTYTDPEIAHVGPTEDEAARRGIAVRAFKIPLEEVDRALTDGETDGFVNILTRRHNGQIVGATIVASHAGEMLNEITAAMVSGLGLGRLSEVIHPYPTQAEAIRKAADQYAQGRIGGKLKWLLNKWLSWRA